jgi:hypothetical protein
VLGLVAAFFLAAAANDADNLLLKFLFYLLTWGCLIFFSHCLAHFVAGSLVGVRFTHYEIGRSSITKLQLPVISSLASAMPLLTLKIDHRSLNSVSRGARAVMFASGAAASTVLPFIVVVASLEKLPIAMSLILLIFSVANALMELYYSPKAGDISRI